MTTIVSKSKGFTLVELLIGTTIFAVIMVLLLQMLNAFEATNDLGATSKRLATIADKAKEYYLSRENLPVPNSTAAVPAPMGEVPLTDFHLEAKYRVDPWGKPIHYFAVRNDGEGGRPGEIVIDPLSTGAPAGAPVAMVIIPESDKTLIDGVKVNGKAVAGVLISSGPDNIFEYTVDTSVSPVSFVLNEGSDDIIVAIDMTLQATQIAQEELRRLGEKVRAFDDRYIGKNNDGDAAYDENGCNANNYPGSGVGTRYIGPRASNLKNEHDTVAVNKYNNPDLVCQRFPYYPAADYLPDDGNDYSCGRPTLDAMQEKFCDTSVGLCPEGYYLPDEQQYDYAYNDKITEFVQDPDNPEIVIEVFVRWVQTIVYCGNIDPDYFRVPIVRGNPQPDDCHWGLVGNPDLDANLLTNDQARAFIFCVYGLSPADIVDPWLNGYTWGRRTNYPDPDPRYHKFFSAGPDRTVNTDDDIVAPL